MALCHHAPYSRSMENNSNPSQEDSSWSRPSARNPEVPGQNHSIELLAGGKGASEQVVGEAVTETRAVVSR